MKGAQLLKIFSFWCLKSERSCLPNSINLHVQTATERLVRRHAFLSVCVCVLALLAFVGDPVFFMHVHIDFCVGLLFYLDALLSFLHAYICSDLLVLLASMLECTPSLAQKYDQWQYLCGVCVQNRVFSSFITELWNPLVHVGGGPVCPRLFILHTMTGMANNFHALKCSLEMRKMTSQIDNLSCILCLAYYGFKFKSHFKRTYFLLFLFKDIVNLL